MSAQEHAVAFCVVGQLSRLHLSTKASRVFAPHTLAGYRAAAYFVLQSGEAKYVNAADDRSREQQMVPAPYARLGAAELHDRIRDDTARAGGDVRNFAVNVSLVDDATTKFLPDEHWASVLDKRNRGIDFNLRRQQLHMLQWSNLRRCMFAIEAGETAMRGRFDVVVKLRDDAEALARWTLPRPWALAGLTTLSCLQWGGLMDANFAVGRPWAWSVMEGLAADWYLEHSRVQRAAATNAPCRGGKRCSSTPSPLVVPFNSESWLRVVATMHAVPLHFATVCELPFISVRHVLVNESLTRALKPTHATVMQTDKTCWTGCDGRRASSLKRALRHRVTCTACSSR